MSTVRFPDDDPPSCPGCGLMAGVCDQYPRCPGGEQSAQPTPPQAPEDGFSDLDIDPCKNPHDPTFKPQAPEEVVLPPADLRAIVGHGPDTCPAWSESAIRTALATQAEAVEVLPAQVMEDIAELRRWSLVDDTPRLRRLLDYVESRATSPLPAERVERVLSLLSGLGLGYKIDDVRAILEGRA